VYVSRSWRDGEIQLPGRVCERLAAAGFRLIGDAEDQAGWDAERVRSIMTSCARWSR